MKVFMNIVPLYYPHRCITHATVALHVKLAYSPRVIVMTLTLVALAYFTNGGQDTAWRWRSKY